MADRMNDDPGFIVRNGVLTEYRGPGGDVTLPAEVTALGPRAFSGCGGLRHVRLPQGLLRIGPEAFRDCVCLEEISLPEGLKVLGEGAFRGCAALRAVNLPKGLRRLPSAVFRDCAALTELRLPETLTELGSDAFCGCGRLTALRLPEGLTTIENCAFQDCAALTEITLPRSLRSLGGSAFLRCVALKRVRLPRELDRLGTAVFSGCLRLAEIGMPERLERLEAYAFAGCVSLTRISLPEGLTDIGREAFFNCPALVTAELPESLRHVGEGAFSGCVSLARADLPEGLETLGPAAFFGCRGLRSIRLPEGLESVGRRVFRGCFGLADEQGFLILNGVLYDHFGSRGPVTVPDGVTRIAPNAFADRSGITDIRLPDGLTDAAEDAFERSRVILRVRRWFPDLTGAAKNCEIFAVVTEDPALLPPRLLPAARLGAALREPGDPGGAASPEELAWLAERAASLEIEAFEQPALLRFLCMHRLLPPEISDDWLKDALEEDDPGLTALLLDYQNALGRETLERARARRRDREEAAAEARARRLAARGPEAGVGGLCFAAAGPLRKWRSHSALRVWLEERGGRLRPQVSEETDWLVTNDPASDSEKCRKAAALGIPALPEAELLAMDRRFSSAPES